MTLFLAVTTIDAAVLEGDVVVLTCLKVIGSIVAISSPPRFAPATSFPLLSLSSLISYDSSPVDLSYSLTTFLLLLGKVAGQGKVAS